MWCLPLEQAPSELFLHDRCIERKKQAMSKRYVKNEKGYKKTSTFDEKMIAEALKRLKAKKWYRLQSP
jgi:hypothetical protein